MTLLVFNLGPAEILILLVLLLLVGGAIGLVLLIVHLVRRKPAAHGGPIPAVTIVDRIAALERIPNNPDGSPRFQVTMSGGSSHPTAPNSVLGYAIERSEFRDRPVRFTLDQRGNITNATPL